MTLRFGSLAALIVALALFACEPTDSDNNGPPAQDPGGATDPGTEPDVALPDPDPGMPDPGTIDPDPGPADIPETPEDVYTGPSYPPGPYGVNVGDTIADLRFWDPFAPRYFYLHELYGRPDVKGFILSAAAGWCGPCQQEAIEFGNFYDLYHSSGLEIVYALFEDEGQNALFLNPARQDKNMAFMEGWKSQFEVEYILVADPKGTDGSFQMEPYFETGAVPLGLVIDASDMTIVYKSEGYSAAYLTYEVLKLIQ